MPFSLQLPALAPDPGLDAQQKIVAVSLAVVILATVVELVRRRKLREEYSAIWVGTALLLVALALQPGLLSWFAAAIGAKTPTSALFFGALLFLMLLVLSMTVRLSRLTFRSKALARQAALVQQELEELRAEVAALRREQPRETAAARSQDGAA